jgi:tetratricopeptide (TPR) repeat protein
MKGARFARVSAGTSIAIALQLWAGAAPEKWIGIRTSRFDIISNAGETSAKDVATRLEEFVNAVASLARVPPASDLPLTVVAFRDDSSFAPFRPKQNGRTLNLSGYFQRADDENLIALSLQTPPDEQPYRVIFHEYAHALMAHAAGIWPLWLYEGLAEFYSTFDAHDAQVVLGRPIKQHVRRLEQEQLLPLRALFAIDRASPMDTEDRQSMFYAESWALVHYLIASDEGKRSKPIAWLIDGLATGATQDAALRDAVRVDLTTLDRNFRAYVADGRYLPVVTAIERHTTRTPANVRTLTGPETDVLQGNLLMRVGRPDEAEPLLMRARAVDPKTPRLEESLGFLALTAGRYDEAAGHLQQAIVQDPQNALARYYYAETLRRRVMEQGLPLPAEVARVMADPLRAAVRLRPSFARAYYLLGYVQFVTGDDLAEGIRLLETAMRLAPPNRAAMLTLASIQLKLREYSAAKATAQAIIDSPDAVATVRADARRVLDAADEGLKR